MMYGTRRGVHTAYSMLISCLATSSTLKMEANVPPHCWLIFTRPQDIMQFCILQQAQLCLMPASNCFLLGLLLDPDFQWTTQHYISDNKTPDSNCYQNIKSNKFNILLTFYETYFRICIAVGEVVKPHMLCNG
jgi:hypothetical protein